MRLRFLLVTTVMLSSLVFPAFLLPHSLMATTQPDAADTLEQQAAQLMVQGILQLQRNQYQEALQSLQAALQQYEALGNRQGQLIVLNSLSSTYFYLGQYREAIAISQQAIEQMQTLERTANLTSMKMLAFMNLGLSYQYLGQYQQAIESLQRSLETAQQANEPMSISVALVHLGDAYRAVGKYEQAIQANQQALTVLRAVPSPPPDSTQAPSTLNTAVAIGQQQAEAGALLNLGIAYRGLKQYPEAIDYMQQALSLAQEIGDRQIESRVLFNLSGIYVTSNQAEQAVNVSQQSIDLARAIKDRQGEAIALGNLGAAYRQLGNADQAILAHQQSLSIKRELGDRSGEAISLSNLGYALIMSNRPQEAELPLRSSINILESLRSQLNNDSERVSLLNTQRYAYENLQNALVAQNKTNEALEIAERGRARAFVELLSRQQTATSKRDLDFSSPSISEIRQIAQSIDATLVEYSIIDEHKLFIWVVQPDGEITFRQTDFSRLLPPAQTTRSLANPAANPLIDEIVTRTRSAVLTESPAARDPRIVRQPGVDFTRSNQLRKLHQMLIEPIADLLPDDSDQRVVFIPQGSLFLVPFAALQDESDAYLIEKHTILTAPSIQVLALTHQLQSSAQSPSSAPYLIIGNPTMPKLPTSLGEPAEQLLSLPAAEVEAQTVAQLLQTEALTGNQATETAVVQHMETAQVIHLATHGLLKYGQPDEFGVLDAPGAIALAPSASDDGLLTASEILGLNLRADLVVLSACDTGRGRITEDGVIGLSRSFMAAGVASVVVSLWTASDVATADLMTEFYRQLQQQPDKASALRQAMLTTMEQYPHPRDWAAFTLMGEAE